MADQMVLKAQKWVNKTYGSVSGYNRCTENGYTGWQTIYSLTRALQHELGITALSDNFGPTTWSRLSTYGKVGISSGNANMRIIAEAALYCKGYNGGNIDGAFDRSTQAGLTAMARDMGLNPDALLTDVTPKVFRALLTMDAYVLTSGGESFIRTSQQWLNKAFINYGQYFIGPCDGHFSRNVQVALVLAIQYQLGMTDSQVTGSIGPATMSGLRDKGYVSTSKGSATWIRLFQCALAFNNYLNNWGDSGGVFNDTLANTVRRFQAFCTLEQTGAGDFQTWMSLLVSTGDPDRKGKAFDCMLPLNAKSVAVVKEAGYRIAGRYLTGGTNKVLTNSEVAIILDAGLSFFPIFQVYGNGIQYFSYDQGLEAGKNAVKAASGFGIPAGTVIYFAVDYDAVDSEITGYLIPHFQGIADAIAAASTRYAIGVYACRNVCSRLYEAGLTVRSFVSGMSTGYSGNLGFALPANWAFDQIKNLTVNGVEIDNDIASGRDLGVNSTLRPRDPNDAFYTFLIWLEARASQWLDKGNTKYSQAELVAQFLRLLDPVNNKIYDFTVGKYYASNEVFGAYDSGFIGFVKNYENMPAYIDPCDRYYLWDSDLTHFGASFGAVATHGLHTDLKKSTIVDFGSWGGDLLSILGQCRTAGVSDDDARDYAYKLIASTDTSSYFGRSDLFADVDAMIIGMRCRNDSKLLLSDQYRNLYANATSAKARFKTFFSLRFNSDATVVRSAVQSMFNIMEGDSIQLIRDYFWLQQFGDITCATPSSLSEKMRNNVAQAFMDRIYEFVN
jgi:peptidoglycan hydrolase-like protein with peptidoglycan-binding domain